MTHQGKQHWPIGGFAIRHTPFSLHEIIKWHHTHKKFLYKQGKLGRTAINYNWYSSEWSPVLFLRDVTTKQMAVKHNRDKFKN